MTTSFQSTKDNQLVVWLYGLFTDVPGDFIKKPMKECTGYEITQEWLYHLGTRRSNCRNGQAFSTVFHA